MSKTIKAGDVKLPEFKVISDQEIVKLTVQQAEKSRVERILKLWANCKIPERHRTADVEKTGKWLTALQMVQSKIGHGFLIAIIGDRGTGKTQIACQIMRSQVRALRSGFYVTATTLFSDIKSTYKNDAPETERDVMQRFQRFKFLIIDEIGRRAENDWEDRILFEIIDGRYREMRDTLLISNQDQPEFEKSIGASVVSRLNESGGFIDCKIKDGWKCYRS